VRDVALNKDAGIRCKHQAHHVGCRVYNSNAMPPSCRLWNCAWLVGDGTENLRRPDRAHYVIDILPDFITLVDNETGEKINQPVVQVWLDPNHPDAHRDPALRAYLDAIPSAALIRLNSKDAFTLFPPRIASDGQWHEIRSGTLEKQHSAAAVRKVLAEIDND
jgi:hypothetical protein